MPADPIVKRLTSPVVEKIIWPPDKLNLIVWDTDVKASVFGSTGRAVSGTRFGGV